MSRSINILNPSGLRLKSFCCKLLEQLYATWVLEQDKKKKKKKERNKNKTKQNKTIKTNKQTNITKRS